MYKNIIKNELIEKIIPIINDYLYRPSDTPVDNRLIKHINMIVDEFILKMCEKRGHEFGQLLDVKYNEDFSIKTETRTREPCIWCDTEPPDFSKK